MKKIGIILFFLISSHLGWSTHIVGGGFSYRITSGNNYIFSLTLYFDFINGNLGAKDRNATCFLFAKSTNVLIDSLVLNLVDSSRFLPFTNPNCAAGSNIRTQIFIYEKPYNMDPFEFNDPNGYYLVWERCCRNNGISNILSPGETGQTFYMEFPPVIKNGQSFFNSSPGFIDLNSDYPCVNQPFKISFKAFDPDGDSLVYSLIAPIKGNSTSTRPLRVLPFPAPYALVNWRPGYSANNPLPGNPGLVVNSSNGLVTCVASQVGLFVFSVLCQEFRNGQKIGEIRREMQLNVKDCQPNSPPTLVVKDPVRNLLLDKNDTLYLNSGSTQGCYKLKLTDAQINQAVRFKVERLSLNTPLAVQKDTTVKLLQIGDSIAVRFCIPACSNANPTQPWKILLIATDDGCSQPLSDSLNLNLVIKRKPVMPPTIKTIDILADTITVIQTEIFRFRLEALQIEPGDLSVFSTLTDSKGVAISVQTNGITLPAGNGTNRIETSFNWPEICFLPENQPLKLMSIARSTVCDSVKYDTVYQYIRIIPKILEVGITSDYSGKNPIEVFENRNINFTVNGKASENRLVTLSSSGTLVGVPGFSFPGITANGSAVSTFLVNTNCESPGGDFDVKIMSSSLFCGVNFKDSLEYKIRIRKSFDSLGIIPNLITANGDKYNESFNILDILPEDNCKLNFDFIEIYDRWGKRIFYSKDRKFVWKPEQNWEGAFFFALHFKEKTIRDWLTVVR